MQISEYSVNNHINSILKAEKETYYIDRERAQQNQQQRKRAKQNKKTESKLSKKYLKVSNKVTNKHYKANQETGFKIQACEY